jgi:hypothetical protein
MFYFAKKVPDFIGKEENKKHQDVFYEISEHSLKTLTAAGVGKDITDDLEETRKVYLKDNPNKKVLKMSIPIKPEEGEFDWLIDLKNKFGEARVAEFEESLLKYTRRKVIKNTSENGSL